MVTLLSRIKIPEDVLFHELSGEAVLLNLASGKYYGLDEVGTRIWLLLSEHKSLENAYQLLLKEYDVEEDRLRTDLFNLVEDLARNGLIEVEPPLEVH